MAYPANLPDKVFDKLAVLVPAKAKVLVAFSGGVDSVVLLDMMQCLRPDIEITLAHYNHQLRSEADSDEAFCRNVAAQKDLEIAIEIGDVRAFAQAEKIGVEEAARTLRHDFLQRACRSYGCELVALGHHANDRAETLLLNFIRGAGLRGLSAMREASSGSNIIRPLLGILKHSIKNYAIDHQIAWVEDVSNSDVRYDRNWLRNSVFPLITSRRVGFIDVVNRSAIGLGHVADYMEQEAKSFLRKSGKMSDEKSYFCDLAALRSAHPALINEVLMQLWIALHGSGAHFSGRVIAEIQRWNGEHLVNGSSTAFGAGVRLVNRNGKLGFKFDDGLLDARWERIVKLIDAD